MKTERVRTRLFSPQEAAGLMGLPGDHPLLKRYQHAFQLFDDGVVTTIVGFFNRTLISPLAESSLGAAPTPEAASMPAPQGLPA